MTRSKPKKNAGGMERRIFPRRVLRTRVIFEDEFGEGFIYFYSTDLSRGGIFLESDVPLKMGTKVFLSFRIPTARNPIRTTAEVVRFETVSVSSEQVIGMGVRFLGLDAATLDTIDNFVENRA